MSITALVVCQDPNSIVSDNFLDPSLPTQLENYVVGNNSTVLDATGEWAQAPSRGRRRSLCFLSFGKC